MTPAPELTDGELRLRAHVDADIPRIIELARDEESLRWTTGIPTPYGQDEAVAFLTGVRAGWAGGSGASWAIEVDGRFAGTVNYTHRGCGVAELGYALHPDARGCGVATRAAHLAIAHAFEQDHVEVLAWRAALGNLASRRVAWANGFTMDGAWPHAFVSSAGTYRDDWAIGHLRRDDPREPRHPWWAAAPLLGDGVRLREWQESDRPSAKPDPIAAQFILSPTMLPTPHGFDRWLLDRQMLMASGEGVFWCIADLATDTPLGGIQIDGLDSSATRGTGSLGYWLDPASRGRGALAAAIVALLPHAFSERTDAAGRAGLGLHRLWAGTDLGNRASQRALRRAGFREVLTEQQVLTRPGKAPTDAISFELLATDDRDAQRVLPAPATVLTTQRLRLRPWHELDRPRADEVDAAAVKNMPAGAMPTASTFDAWLARRRRLHDAGNYDLCIADRSTDEALGSVLLFGIDREIGHGEVGYWLFPHARGHGYPDEALAALVEHAFSCESDGGAGLDRLHAGTVLDNYSSRATLLRNGFRRWGEDHQAYVAADGERSDGAYYELLRSWRAEPSPSLDLPVLTGEDVRLRPWRSGDAPRVVEACTDPTTRHWLAGLPDPYTEAVALAFIHGQREEAAAGSKAGWCVADRETDACVGTITVMAMNGYDPTAAEVGYWTHPAARGRGVMSQALGLALQHAFRPRTEGGLGRRRLTLNVAAGNEASAAIARRHGFQQVGTDRAGEPLGDGSIVDLWRFDLLREEHASAERSAVRH